MKRKKTFKLFSFIVTIIAIVNVISLLSADYILHKRYSWRIFFIVIFRFKNTKSILIGHKSKNWKKFFFEEYYYCSENLYSSLRALCFPYDWTKFLHNDFVQIFLLNLNNFFICELYFFVISWKSVLPMIFIILWVSITTGVLNQGNLINRMFIQSSQS